MVLGEDPYALMDEIGHDGHERIHPELDEPYCFRGHHPQELVDLFYLRDLALLTIQLYPNFAPNQTLIAPAPELEQRLADYLTDFNAILIGKTRRHAVAWSKADQLIYDPNGRLYKINSFSIREALVAVPIKV